MGDWPIHLLNTQFGDYWYVAKVMGVHRLHSGGTWMSQEMLSKKRFTVEAYNIMIRGFETKPELQKQMIEAKEAFINPPKNPTT